MEVDAASVLGLVTRTVRNFEKDDKAASAVTLTRLCDTGVDDFWDTLTSKQRIPRWFLPIEGELKVGGRYQLQGNAGGSITVCTPPSHFAATWEFGGGTNWIDVSVAAERGKARMTLEHTAIVEDHWNQFGLGAVGDRLGSGCHGTGTASGNRGSERPCGFRGLAAFAERQGVHQSER